MNQGENTTWGIRLLVFFLNKFYLFMYICMYVCMYVCIGCVGSSLLCVGFLQLWRAGATLCCGAQASHCSGFFCCGARALGAQASVVVARGLQSTGSVVAPRHVGSSQTRARTRVSCIGRRILNHCAIREAQIVSI